MNKLENEIRELTETELNTVVGGSHAGTNNGTVILAESLQAGWHSAKQKPDGSAAGNVAAKWNVAQGAAA